MVVKVSDGRLPGLSQGTGAEAVSGHGTLKPFDHGDVLVLGNRVKGRRHGFPRVATKNPVERKLEYRFPRTLGDEGAGHEEALPGEEQKIRKEVMGTDTLQRRLSDR